MESQGPQLCELPMWTAKCVGSLWIASVDSLVSGLLWIAKYLGSLWIANVDSLVSGLSMDSQSG